MCRSIQSFAHQSAVFLSGSRNAFGISSPGRCSTRCAYAYSNIADISYKRLTRTISVPAGGGNLSFWISRDTEPDWDFVFVEAHTVGQEDWTTLPDLNGHTSDDVCGGCPDPNPFWLDENPFLRHYITRTQTPDTVDCTPTGTSGTWNAATGNSAGYQDWSVDLSAFAGKQVEISITYATDPAVEGLGVFLDVVAIVDGATTLTSTSFARTPPRASR